MNKGIIAIALGASGLLGCAHDPRGHSAVMGSLPPAVKSLPVPIVPSFEHPVLAWSTAGMMERYICYNPRVAAKLPQEVLAFALVHEYAHLHLNHIAPFDSPKSPAEIKQRELGADHFAARFWATNDVKVAQAAAKAFLSPKGQGVFGSGKSIETGYPTNEERAQAILDCLADSPGISRQEPPRR